MCERRSVARSIRRQTKPRQIDTVGRFSSFSKEGAQASASSLPGPPLPSKADLVHRSRAGLLLPAALALAACGEQHPLAPARSPVAHSAEAQPEGVRTLSAEMSVQQPGPPATAPSRAVELDDHWYFEA